MNELLLIIIIGVGATVTMDIWGLIRKTLLGIAGANYGLVGRWVAHMPHGRFRHEAISKASPVRGEHALGWIVHYLVGIAFAGLLIGVFGTSWLDHPTPGPALAIGLGTVVIPFLVMQPGMGAGIAASRTPNPAAARLQSLITHGVFGLGLYASGWAMHVLLG